MLELRLGLVDLKGLRLGLVDLKGLRLRLVIFVECLIVMSYYRATIYQQNINVTSNASSLAGKISYPSQNKIIEFGCIFWQPHFFSVLVSLVSSRLLR